MKKIYPFKFLDAYTREDSPIFFGREEEVEALYTMVFQTNIVVVYGESGTGKTSLIQCGLASRFQSHDWLAIPIRRGSNLNESFEKALAEASGDLQTTTDDFDWLNEETAEMLLKTTARPLTSVEQSLQRSFKAIFLRHFRPIYLLFDQFEELFILGSPEEQTQFIQTVKAILRVEQPVKLIISIREEYLGALYEFEKAVPQLLRKKMRVEPMNLDKVRQVIVGATTYAASNVRLDTPDTERITAGIFEKIKGTDKKITIQLPYLQVFLDRLYLSITRDESRQAYALITLNELDKLAGIGDVLSDFLEEQVGVISRLLHHPPHQVSTDTIWRILSPFVTLEGTKEPISQQNLLDRLSDLDPTLVAKALKALADRRILRSSEGTDFYEIAHDSLALKIAEKRSGEETNRMQIQRLLQNQLTFREREAFTEKQLSFIEPYLEKMKLSADEQALINESRRAVHQLKEKQQKEKEKQQRDKWRLYGSIGLVLIIIGWFWINRRQQQALAEQRNQQAQYFGLTEWSTLYLYKEGDATKGFRYAQYAWQKDSTGSEARAAVYSAVFPSSTNSSHFLYRSLKHTNAVYSAVYSANGRTVLTASEDSTARLWDASSGRLLASLRHTNAVYSAVFSPDGKTVLTASEDSTARLWDAPLFRRTIA